VTEIVEASDLFSSRELTDMIVRETDRYKSSFNYHSGCLLGHGSIQKRDNCMLYLVCLYSRALFRNLLCSCISSQKRVISTPEFGDIIIRGRLELICKLLHFATNETIDNFEGTKSFSKCSQ
jgi:hypothetical protein